MIKIILLLATCLVQHSLAFTLEGNWTLFTIGEKNVSIGAVVDQYVFRSSFIMNRLSFRTCNALSYQVSIDANNFWVNIDTELIDTTSSCSDNDVALTQIIRQNIRSVFTFGIVANQLFLYDTSEDVLMMFNRSVINDQEKNGIKGRWLFTLDQDSSKQYDLIADQSTITACNGSIYKYTLNYPYAISLSGDSSNCKDQKLVQILAKISFYRKNEGKIRLYDGSISLLGQATVDLGSTAINTPQMTINPLPTSPQMTVAKPKQDPIGLTPGSYILLLLYRRDLMRAKVQITPTTIGLTLCSKLIFNYSLESSSSMTITSTSTPNQKCSKADESIYFNYIISAATYNIDSEGLITLVDGSNRSIVSLVPQ